MARPRIPSAPSTASYQGVVWTDGRGYATVSVPPDAAKVQPPLEYPLDAVDGIGLARIAAELWDGRFTIETDEPHVKVAWRITGQRASHHQQQQKEKRR
jgi:hypothetical protein